MIADDKPTSLVLGAALDLIFYDGWVQGGAAGAGGELCLTSAVNLANHGRPEYTEDLPENWVPENRLRRRATQAFRVLADAVEPNVDHESLGTRQLRKMLEEWNDVFARQQCEVEAAYRRAYRLALEREEIGLLRL